MKRVKILSSIFIILLGYCTNIYAQGEYKIMGSTNESLNGAEIVFRNISYWKFEKTQPAIFSVVKNRRFYISGSINNEYEYYILSITKNNVTNSYHCFISARQMKIHIKNITPQTSDENITYTNVPFVKETKSYLDFMKEAEETKDTAYKRHSEYNRGLKKDSVIKDSLLNLVRQAKKNWMLKNIDFFKKNPGSFVSLYYFTTEVVNYPKVYISPDSILKIYSNFSTELKQSGLGKSVYLYIAKKQGLLEEKILPNFPFIANDNKNYELSQFRDKKVVLLCFWASWCIPCIENFPLLRKIDSLYSSKGLQLISISIDNNKKFWFDALQKYKLPWLQTCDMPELTQGVRIRNLYDIDRIPQYFLIDTKGSLLYQSIQSNDTNYLLLESTLKTYFNKQ